MKRIFISSIAALFALSLCANPTEDVQRWELNSEGKIAWDVTKGGYPHGDHIEMTGEQMSFVLRWELDDNSTLSMERSLVFPMLRKLPDNTHASLMHRVALDVPSIINVDGLSLKNGKTENVTIDGMFEATDVWSIGKHNIGSGRGTAPVPAVRMHRTIFPSVDKPALCEIYSIENIRERDAVVYVPEYTQVYRTLAEKGRDGVYVISAAIQGSGTYTLKKGESISFAVICSARRENEPALVLDMDAELAARQAFVENDITNALVLDTPDPVINAMFRYAKIRTSESICKTSGGYMHAPGGESYYAAIWANDQAEYVNRPFHE